MTNKRCSRCGLTQDVSRFSRQAASKDSLRSQCKACDRVETRTRVVRYALESPDLIVTEKKCTRCREMKARSEYYKEPRAKDGLQAQCKECKAAYAKTYRKANAGSIAAQQRAWRETHKEQVAVVDKARRMRHKAMYSGPTVTEKWCSDCKEVKPADEYYMSRIRPDGLASYCKLCTLTRGKVWRAALRARRPEPTVTEKQCPRCTRTKPIGEFNRSSIALDGLYWCCKSCVSEHGAAYHIAHPDKAWRDAKRRRAFEASAVGSHTKAEWEALCARVGYLCLCCGRGVKLQQDHVVPLSMGGSNLITNIQPLCLSCNSSKHQKTIDFRGGNAND